MEMRDIIIYKAIAVSYNELYVIYERVREVTLNLSAKVTVLKPCHWWTFMTCSVFPSMQDANQPVQLQKLANV